jgi:hypothetical protein
MAKKDQGRRSERLKRADSDREAPHRSVTGHIKRNARSRKGKNTASDKPKSSVKESVSAAISDMVQLSSEVIEEQIRAGQTAAERLRDGLANSKELSTDVTMLVENLVATTRDVAATWLDLLSIVVRSIGTQKPAPGGGTPRPTPGTKTEVGSSGGAKTVSSVTPADPAISAIPPLIVVKGVRVKDVKLDLKPHSPHFVPIVHQLLAKDPEHRLTGVKFEASPDESRLIVTVTVPRDQPAGIYSGTIVDSSSNEPGGTIGVTVAD